MSHNPTSTLKHPRLSATAKRLGTAIVILGLLTCCSSPPTQQSAAPTTTAPIEPVAPTTNPNETVMCIDPYKTAVHERILTQIASLRDGAYEQAREQETKNWVYDLIKGEGEFVFVAEVPGPEDKIAVRLVDGILYVRGTGGFSKEVPIEGANEMQIFDFKYRNGVLTLRIK